MERRPLQLEDFTFVETQVVQVVLGHTQVPDMDFTSGFTSCWKEKLIQLTERGNIQFIFWVFIAHYSVMLPIVPWVSYIPDLEVPIFRSCDKQIWTLSRELCIVYTRTMRILYYLKRCTILTLFNIPPTHSFIWTRKYQVILFIVPGNSKRFLV